MAAAAVISLSVALMLAGVALGRDSGEITATEGQTVEKDYGPIPANEPPGGILFGNFGQRSPATCKDNSPYCDVVTLNIQVPGHYTSSHFFKVDIVLTWPDPSGANDLNMYLHRTNGTQVLASATATQPEKITLQDPSEPQYLIVVSNARGPNSGYRLSVTFVPQGSISAPEEPEEFGSGSQSSRFDDDEESDTSFQDLPAVPQPEGALASTGPRPVERPGEDGAIARRELLVLATSGPPGGNSRLPFIVSSVAAAVVVTGLGVFLYLRGKQDPDF